MLKLKPVLYADGTHTSSCFCRKQ